MRASKCFYCQLSQPSPACSLLHLSHVVIWMIFTSLLFYRHASVRFGWSYPQRWLPTSERWQTEKGLKHTYRSLSRGETVGNFSNTWAYSRRNICIWQTRLGFFGSLLLPSNIHKFNFQSALLLLVWVLLNEIASSYYNILPGPANVARSWYSNSITWPVLSAWH